MPTTTYDTGYGSVSTYYSWTGLNYQNQVGSSIVFPKPVTVTEIWIHGGGYGTTAYTYHCMWDNSGSLLGNSGTITWPDGRAWRGATGLSIQCPAGTNWVGFWANPSYARQWSENGAGNNYRVTATGGVTSLTGGTYVGDKQLIAYVVCQEGYIWIHNGTAWRQFKNIWVHDGASWRQAKGVWVHNGSYWVRAL